MAAKLNSKPIRVLVLALFIIYTVVVVQYVIIKYQMPWVKEMLKDPGLINFRLNIRRGIDSGNFVPFATIQLYINAYYQQTLALSYIIDNLLGNIAVLIPFGIMVPILWKPAKRFSITMLLGLVYILGIEGVQLVTALGVFDVDDIILNLLGVFIGYLFIRILMSTSHS